MGRDGLVDGGLLHILFILSFMAGWSLLCISPLFSYSPFRDESRFGGSCLFNGSRRFFLVLRRTLVPGLIFVFG